MPLLKAMYIRQNVGVCLHMEHIAAQPEILLRGNDPKRAPKRQDLPQEIMMKNGPFKCLFVF